MILLLRFFIAFCYFVFKVYPNNYVLWFILYQHRELRSVITGFPVVEALVGMGYSRTEIEDSLAQAKYDDVFATYLLLGRKSTDVSIPLSLFVFLLFLQWCKESIMMFWTINFSSSVPKKVVYGKTFFYCAWLHVFV